MISDFQWFSTLPVAAAIFQAAPPFHLQAANEEFAKLLAINPEQWLGKPITECLPLPDATSVETLSTPVSGLRISLNQQQKTGGMDWLELKTSLLDDGLAVLVLQDVSREEQQLKELSAERDRLLGFIETAPLGMVALDWVSSGVAIISAQSPQRPILYMNHALETLTGYHGEEAQGQPYVRFFANSGNQQATLQQVEQALAKGTQLRLELVCQRKDGSGCWSELTLSPIYEESGSLTHILGVLTDISERKEAEAKLQALSAALAESREDLIAILNEFPNGTLLIESTGQLGFISDRCQTILGLDPASALGQPWQKALPFDAPNRSLIQRNLQLPANQRERLELPWQEKTGTVHWVECEMKDDPRDASRHLVFWEDISELRRLREQLGQQRIAGMVGNSEAMAELGRIIGEVAKGDWTVLVEGETGVGKELVARSIHEASPRRAGPYIAVNSAGLSESLLASQLFGHKKGTFTGATSDQAGFFEAASGGTLFLDEIGDLPLPMQASLLRVLQEREITRLGETRTRSVDVRVVAATHKDLAAEAKAGRFREDLLFRLRVARLNIPPLRQRKTDIPLLVEHFLASARKQTGKPLQALSADAWQKLMVYDWPGNVRELKACVDFAAIYSQGAKVQATDLPPEIRNQPESTPEPSLFLPEADERQRILAALERTKGKRSHAAQLLGISRATFYRRLTELGIEGKT